MKKALIGAALALSVLAANAQTTPVSVSFVKDTNVHETGVRVATEIKGFDLGLTHVNGQYNRISAGMSHSLWKNDKTALKAAIAGVHQTTLAKGSNGYGLTVGLNLEHQVDKQVYLVAGVEHFIGQGRLEAFDGNVVTVGLKVKF